MGKEQIVDETIPNGIYNVVGKHPFQMNEFIKSIANAQNRKVILPNVPAFFLKLGLGEASAILLNSYRITSPKMDKENLHQYNSLEEALQAL